MFQRTTPINTEYERKHRHLTVSDLVTAWGFVAVSFVAILLFG